jgi:hypothetical protein
MIPFLFALIFSILLTLVFVIPGIFLFFRWISILLSLDFNVGDMKVPTFYSSKQEGSPVAYIFFISVVGVVFGGIHCVGWFFTFPSSDEAILWRVCSAALTGTALLLTLLVYPYVRNVGIIMYYRLDQLLNAVCIGFLLVYMVSRLYLLVEAFISLRHLTPGMLALVKWTSFIPHI